jgi:AraC-like DNA-binding protein
VKDTLHHVLYLASGTILLILVLVVWLRHKTQNYTAKAFLLGYLFSFFLAVFTGYIVLTPNLVLKFPHFFRTAHFFYSLVMPFSFLYFREVTKPGRSSWKDGLLFLPVLLYVVDFMPVFIKSAEEKRAILLQMNDYGLRIGYTEGWIMPPGGYHLLRSTMAVLCWVLQAKLFFTQKSRPNPDKQEKMQRRWLRFLLWSGVLIFMPNIITGLLMRPDLTIQWSNFAALIAAIIQGYFLLLHPELLYGMQEQQTILATTHESSTGKAIKKLSEDRTPAYYDQLDPLSIQQIEKAINEWFDEKKIYLSAELTLAGLSSFSGIGLHKWSAYLNKFKQIGFNDFINQYRIDYCVKKINQGEYKAKTLEALSHESGFSSRSTFIRAFKKCKGVTPTEFIMQGN